MIKGLEDDTYQITEIETANGYSLLKNRIVVNITATEDTARACYINSIYIISDYQKSKQTAQNSRSFKLFISGLNRKFVCKKYFFLIISLFRVRM